MIHSRHCLSGILVDGIYLIGRIIVIQQRFKLTLIRASYTRGIDKRR